MKKKSILFIMILSLLNIFCSNLSAAEEVVKKPRILILSLYNDAYKHIGGYSDPNKEKYAKKHGYDLIIYHDLLDHSRPAPWSKIVAIQKHLKDYDWVFWSDADSLLMNMQINLEDIIDDKFNFIISKESSYGALNTGSFLIKNCQWSENLLKKIYDQKAFINHSWWEQGALAHLLKIEPDLLKNIKVLPQRALNSNIYPEWPEAFYRVGDFVLHFYGPCDKEKLMREWSLKIIGD